MGISIELDDSWGKVKPEFIEQAQAALDEFGEPMGFYAELDEDGDLSIGGDFATSNGGWDYVKELFEALKPCMAEPMLVRAKTSYSDGEWFDCWVGDRADIAEATFEHHRDNAADELAAIKAPKELIAMVKAL